MRFDAYFLYDYHKDSHMTDFQTPFGMKLLSGGSISKNIGYYFYFYLSEMGEIAGVEDAYIHFNDLFGADFDLMVGQFQVSDPLFKRELRLTYADYHIYKVRVGDTVTNLTYDRGVMFSLGTDIGLDAFFSVVNGNGKGEANGTVPGRGQLEELLAEALAVARAGPGGRVRLHVQFGGEQRRHDGEERALVRRGGRDLRLAGQAPAQCAVPVSGRTRIRGSRLPGARRWRRRAVSPS